jgi:hypothetical protein
MDFKAQYLQAMRDQALAMFKRLSKSGELETHAAEMSMEAGRMLRDLLAGSPKDKDGEPTLCARREAEEYLRAALLEFPSETTDEEDEMAALLGSRPLV